MAQADETLRSNRRELSGYFLATYRDPVGWRIGLGVWFAHYLLNLGFVFDSGRYELIAFFTIMNAAGIIIGAACWPLWTLIEGSIRLHVTAPALIVSGISTSIYITVLFGFVAPNYEATIEYPSLLGPIQLTFLVYFAAYGLYATVLRNRRVLQTQKSAMEQAVLAQSARVETLRYQVNPHFLFNTLNACSTLIAENRPQEARRTIGDLADFYRSALSDSASELVPLIEEVRLQQRYLGIEQIRFGDRMSIEINVAPEVEAAQVPVLILQPLVENAVKHGIARTDQAVAITINATVGPSGLRVQVANPNPAGAPSSQPGTGTGLTNVRHRVEAAFGDAASITVDAGDPFIVTLDLPVIQHD